MVGRRRNRRRCVIRQKRNREKEEQPVFFNSIRKKINSEIGIITRGEQIEKMMQNIIRERKEKEKKELTGCVTTSKSRGSFDSCDANWNKAVKVSKSKERTTTVKVQEKDCKNLKGIEENSQAANEEDQNKENDQRDDNERSASNTEDGRLQI
nr:hypothetical protein [Tanacetum cinerariifolium]